MKKTSLLKTAEVAERAKDSIAASEVSLYHNVLRIKEAHDLEVLGIAFYDYETTIGWSYNADTYFHAASTMKLAVLLGVFREIDRGQLTLESPVHVRNRFTSIVNQQPFMLALDRDSDPFVYTNLGKTMTVYDLAYQMITTSSNLATNLLIEVIGVPTIQRSLEELDINGVKVIRGVEDQAAFDAGLSNEVTAHGLLSLLKIISEERAYSVAASQKMLEIMHDQQFNSGIPKWLPKAARVAHKTGNISTIHHDAGIVYLENRKPYVLVILTAFDAQTGRSSAVAEVSRDIFSTLAGIING
ncbi:MAG TPA: serine hydrolase [Thermoanaerobaculia bacterium]|nr:serine hydrolase [Thermoanaerobaculia bacterium]